MRNFFDRLFHRKSYNYQQILRKYSHTLTHPMPDLDRFAKLTPYLLCRSLRLSGASVMVLDRESQNYIIRAGDRDCEKLVGQSVQAGSLLVQELSRGKELNFKTIKSPELRLELQKLKAVLLIPSISESDYFNQRTLLATINLGEKLSGQAYSREDIEFLETMANQASISIEYAFILEELKKHQAQTIKSEKLAAIGYTTAGVAHELKNPLTYLLTVAQAMPASWDKPAFRESVIKMFPAEVERMKLIIDGLSDYSKTRELKLEAADIVEIVEKTLAVLGYEIRKYKVFVIKAFPPAGEKIFALGDKNRLVQVFMNLIANAIQAMGQNVSEREKSGDLTIAIRLAARQIRVSISDTGPGIPPENLQKVFDPFFTTKEAGTGLGLSITKKIIDEHKGSFYIDSHVGKGTTFTVCLPSA